MRIILTTTHLQMNFFGSTGAEEHKTLDRASAGVKYRIDSIDHANSSAARLSSLGFLTGRIIRLARVAPMGDPVAVDLIGQRIGLRKMEARAITVVEWSGHGSSS